MRGPKTVGPHAQVRATAGGGVTVTTHGGVGVETKLWVWAEVGVRARTGFGLWGFKAPVSVASAVPGSSSSSGE